ncbi:MAG TPA: hypothetical protein VGO50_18910 [Pyrinomonadaceae bacterium]|jgi:hypothetical protein|nr:hypothetical protein [Pyrinomonadaceae bacterium]
MKGTAKLLFCLSIILWTVCSAGAQNAAKNWLFGNNARIDFNSGSPLASAMNPPTINALEGSASISDSNGNLLFYTDGRQVWDRNNNVMPNGTGLAGHDSSTQSALIVPCDCNRYFIFTTDAQQHGYSNGLQYSLVDMSVNGGTVTLRNQPLLAPAAEKIAAVRDGSGGFWVVGHKIGTDQFIPTTLPPAIAY